MIVTIIFMLIAAIGFIGVQMTGNYENAFGYMLIFGGAATLGSLLVHLVMFLI